MSTPDSLVESGVRLWGRFSGRPAHVNPLDAHRGLARRWHDFRLKEWVGFTLVHPQLAGSMIIQDAKYLATSEFYVFDRASGTLDEHSSTARRTAVDLPIDLLHGGRCRFTTEGYELRYVFDERAGAHSIHVAIGATATAQAVHGDLRLNAYAAPPALSVSSRLGTGATMYTHKRIYPAHGELRVGSRTFRFDPARDFAIIDEHRSELPYAARWTWGTFATRMSDGIMGANFAVRPQRAGHEEESCIWMPKAAEPLADIAFRPAAEGPGAGMQVTSADGRLDVVFTPDGHKGVNQNFGVAAIRYQQSFGSYDGSLNGMPIRGARGVWENMRMRA